MSAVAIKDSKKLAFGPTFTSFIWGFLNIEYNRYSVLVILSHDALVSVGCVCFDGSVLFGGALGLLKVWELHVTNIPR